MVGQEVPSATPDTLTSFIGDTATLNRAAFLEKYAQPVLVALTWRLDRRADEGSTSDRAVAGDPNVEVGLTSAVWKIRKRQRQSPDTFWIGRSRHNDVILNLADVSKVHAYFSRADGAWFLTDLESRNGTRVGDAELPPLSTHPIQPGQVIRIGATARFLFLDGAGLWDLLERVRQLP
jgi:pSer/pThr/pTyr-binding forkhead associated (FHA) protein